MQVLSNVKLIVLLSSEVVSIEHILVKHMIDIWLVVGHIGGLGVHFNYSLVCKFEHTIKFTLRLCSLSFSLSFALQYLSHYTLSLL